MDSLTESGSNGQGDSGSAARLRRRHREAQARAEIAALALGEARMASDVDEKRRHLDLACKQLMRSLSIAEAWLEGLSDQPAWLGLGEILAARTSPIRSMVPRGRG